MIWTYYMLRHVPLGTLNSQSKLIRKFLKGKCVQREQKNTYCFTELQLILKNQCGWV